MSPDDHFKAAAVDHPVSEIIRMRWSPRSFDESASLADSEVHTLLEAARWAPSANNAQPWRYLLGRRGTPAFASIYGTLNPTNASWAGKASLLVLAVARLNFDDGRLNGHAAYDVGQSVAYLVLQATALGLVVHQMAGFEASLGDRFPEYSRRLSANGGSRGRPSSRPCAIAQRAAPRT